MRSDDSCWHEAMKVEMNSNRGNGTGIVRSTSGAGGPNIEMEAQATDEGGRFDRAVHDRARSRLRRNLFTTGPLSHLELKIHQLNAVTASRQIVEQLEVFGGRSKQVSYGTRSSKRYLLRDIGLQQSKWREGSHRGRICGRPSVPGEYPCCTRSRTSKCVSRRVTEGSASQKLSKEMCPSVLMKPKGSQPFRCVNSWWTMICRPKSQTGYSIRSQCSQQL